MNEATNTPRSKALLDKVFDHLESIEVEKLSMRELEDFLEVVRKGQFLESSEQTSSLLSGNLLFPLNHQNANKGPDGTAKTSAGTTVKTPEIK